MLWYFYVPDDPTSFWTSFCTALTSFTHFQQLWGSSFLPFSQVFQCIFFWWIFWLPSLSCSDETKYFTLLFGARHRAGCVGWKGWKSNNPISCLTWSIHRALSGQLNPPGLSLHKLLPALPACTAFMETRKGQTILTPQLSQGKLVDILRSDMI